MGHIGYYGQYSGNSKFSKKRDEDYDAKEAYNKNLKASARLHYLENLRHDHDSPAHQDKKMMAKKMTCVDGYEMNENGKCVPVKRNAALKNIDPREDKSSYEYDYDFAADKKAARKAKRNAAAQKHCMN